MTDLFTTPGHDPFMDGAGGPPAVKFATIGDTYSGVVIEIEKRQDTAPDGTVKTWSNGDPMSVFRFTLDDNGELRSLFVRGNMVTAVRDAAKVAGARTLIGWKLTVQHHALGEARRGFSPPKLYQAKVEPAPARSDFEAPF